MKEYERLKKKEEEETAEKSADELNKKISNFLKHENNIVSKPLITSKINLDGPSTSSISNMSGGKDKELPSFWVPSKTPSAEKPKIEKPVCYS